jgi:hypothetical protein
LRLVGVFAGSRLDLNSSNDWNRALLVFQVPEPEFKPFDQGWFVIGFLDLGARFLQLFFFSRFTHVVSIVDSHLDLLALRSSIRKQYASHEQEKEDNFMY